MMGVFFVEQFCGLKQSPKSDYATSNPYLGRKIMNLLLDTFSSFWTNFVAKITTVEMIIAIAFAIVGVSIAILARKITKTVRKSDKIEDSDSLYISLKVVGLVCLFIAILIIIFRAGV